MTLPPRCRRRALTLPFSVAAAPGLAERDGLMALWAECSGSAGLFHTALDRVAGHMTRRYQGTLREKYPQSCQAGCNFLRAFFQGKLFHLLVSYKMLRFC